MFESATLLLVLLTPLAIAILRSRRTTVADFVLNSNRSSLLQTIASIVGGNVGIGTFIAIFLFSNASPLIGISLAVTYTAGLLLCALVAPRVHRASRDNDAFGLVDFIASAHGIGNPALIWLPVAVVFMLRTVVQVMALAAIVGAVFQLPFAQALGLSALLASTYVVVGGYKAATETDIFQVAIIVTVMVLALFGLTFEFDRERDYLDLGPYKPILLLGIFLFIPLSPILAVDNWQRIATAPSPLVARRAYMIAALICGAIYTIIVMVALQTGPATDVLERFRNLMPGGQRWLADAMFAACIMSSIDTFVMPLVTTFARKGLSLRSLRALVAGLFLVVATVALAIGDILSGIIAAFNSLTVFLPAVLGALLLRKPSPRAAVSSLCLGVVSTLLLSAVDINSAALAGFLLSAATYGLIHWVDRRRASLI